MSDLPRPAPVNDKVRLEFLAALQSRSLRLPDGEALEADGQWHRCDATNKVNGAKDGSYLLRIDGPRPFGVYRNWTDGKPHDHWHGDRTRALTEAEQREFEQWLEQARAEAAEQAVQEAEKARVKAQDVWAHARPAPPDHPYLIRKDIKPNGLRTHREWRRCLLAPIYDPTDGQIVSDKRAKWYLRGGRVKGCCSTIDGSRDQIVVTEGWATGASIHEATGCCVAVALNCHNLKDIAVALRGAINNEQAAFWSMLRRQQAASEADVVPVELPRLPDIKLVIAADDDWKNPDNPGLMHALSAAFAANALIAVPDFGDDREEHETDFNDLRQISLRDVKGGIEGAVEPGQFIKQRLLADRYAAFSPMWIKQLARLEKHDLRAFEELLGELGQGKEKIRTSTLRGKIKEVATTEAASLETNDDLDPELHLHWTVEPWEEPVETRALIEEITAEVDRYIATLGKRAIVVALWIMFTWVHHVATHSPMFVTSSAEKDCGKTTLLGVMAFLVKRGLQSVNISGPALFRSLEKWRPTLMTDEADTAFANNTDLKEVTNSGWTRGQGVIRCDPETHEPQLYSTFAPKAIGGKGIKLPDTTRSRSIICMLHRKTAGEVVEDFDFLDHPELATLRRRLARWAADNADALRTAQPQIPEGFHNRLRMNWKPLLAIAELAGMGDEARQAALLIESSTSTDKLTQGQRLLADILDIFKAEGHR
jgi:putative DNA primase/helicase